MPKEQREEYILKHHIYENIAKEFIKILKDI